jgi:predicted secreted hydrolase
MRCLGLLLCLLAGGDALATSAYAPVVEGRPISFPSDHGSHPDFRTEWWYVTGWLNTRRGEPLGFQITFFRTKPDIDPANPSAFAPRQLLIAHCAISDPKRGRLWQDQRIRRAGFELADAKQGDTNVWIESWSLRHRGGHYHAQIDAEDFSLTLSMTESQDALINGHAGVSRKDPDGRAASYYYSLPHLQVSGSITRAGAADNATGEAWFDHEWSSEYLSSQAQGWDWTGINFADGGSLMAFRVRGPHEIARWAGGTYRTPDGTVQELQPADIEFEPQRRWVSPRTNISYPVQWRVRAGDRIFDLLPLMDDQENDTRLSTGAIYWEGAVRAFSGKQLVGQGYLELTGYGGRLQLR